MVKRALEGTPNREGVKKMKSQSLVEESGKTRKLPLVKLRGKHFFTRCMGGSITVNKEKGSPTRATSEGEPTSKKCREKMVQGVRERGKKDSDKDL